MLLRSMMLLRRWQHQQCVKHPALRRDPLGGALIGQSPTFFCHVAHRPLCVFRTFDPAYLYLSLYPYAILWPCVASVRRVCMVYPSSRGACMQHAIEVDEPCSSRRIF